MPSIRALTLADVVIDPALVESLIAEGETLFVERKREIPAKGLAPTIASFANTLGGWVLLGVDNDGEIFGYEWEGRADLQDHVREHLRGAVDPLPPFAAASVDIGGKTVGVIRVAESVDTPHIVAGTGALFVRLPGGKEPVTDHRTLLEMARRGQDARSRAARDLYGLPLVESEMNRSERLPGETPLGAEEPARVIEWIVRVRPLTVPGHFADRALTASTGQTAAERISALVPASPIGPSHGGGYQARARGVFASALAVHPTAMRAEVVVDAGGVVAARMVMHRMRGVAHLDSAEHTIVRLLRVAADTITGLDALGRAVASLEVRGADGLTVESAPQSIGVLQPEALLEGNRFRMDGDVALPADDEEVAAVVGRWTRELARAAGLLAFEPEM